MSFAGNIIPAVADDAQQTGEKLVRRLFADIKAKKWDIVDGMIATGFQSIQRTECGTGSRRSNCSGGWIWGITNEKFQGPQDGPALVVTYAVSGTEMIDGEPTETSSAQRMTVFIKEGNSWKWLAHANMITIKR
jgi:hypothetical protein